MPSARVGIECGLMQTATQNKSRNSGRQKSRAEGGRAPLSCGREAERTLPGVKLPSDPRQGLSPAAGLSFPSTAERWPFCLESPEPHTVTVTSTGHRVGPS